MSAGKGATVLFVYCFDVNAGAAQLENVMSPPRCRSLERRRTDKPSVYQFGETPGIAALESFPRAVVQFDRNRDNGITVARAGLLV